MESDMTLKLRWNHIRSFCERVERERDLRRNAGSGQHLGLHGVQSLALTDAQLNLHSVVGVVLKEEAIVDDKLGI